MSVFIIHSGLCVCTEMLCECVCCMCQYDVCKNYVGSVYVGVYGGLSESGLCVFSTLCPVGFLVACRHVIC